MVSCHVDSVIHSRCLAIHTRGRERWWSLRCDFLCCKAESPELSMIGRIKDLDFQLSWRAIRQSFPCVLPKQNTLRNRIIYDHIYRSRYIVLPHDTTGTQSLIRLDVALVHKDELCLNAHPCTMYIYNRVDTGSVFRKFLLQSVHSCCVLLDICLSLRRLFSDNDSLSLSFILPPLHFSLSSVYLKASNPRPKLLKISLEELTDFSEDIDSCEAFGALNPVIDGPCSS